MTTQFEAQCTCISARLFLGKSGRDGCGMVVAEVGPEQNLALHLVLLASGKEWTRRWERERVEHYGQILGFRAERLIGERAFKWIFRIRFPTFANVMS